jgi:hypothetical protein
MSVNGMESESETSTELLFPIKKVKVYAESMRIRNIIANNMRVVVMTSGIKSVSRLNDAPT